MHRKNEYHYRFGGLFREGNPGNVLFIIIRSTYTAGSPALLPPNASSPSLADFMFCSSYPCIRLPAWVHGITETHFGSTPSSL